jgi:hypothetical protein
LFGFRDGNSFFAHGLPRALSGIGLGDALAKCSHHIIVE